VLVRIGAAAGVPGARQLAEQPVLDSVGAAIHPEIGTQMVE
jgi:hypothetical protein